jgi:predicted lipoprotein with Yx(FWY)xxD motif
MTRLRLLPPAILSAAALALAACGSDGGDDPAGVAAAGVAGTTDTAATDSASTPGSAAPVGTIELDGLGTALTDAEGRVLYVSDEEEADPDVLCTDACEEFWAPAEAGTDAPSGDPSLGELGIAERPDGTQQLTRDGRRLYTFTLDDPGEAGGEGLSDTFDGQRFTWHVALVEETPAGSTAGTDVTVAGESTPGAGAGGSGTEPASDVADYPGY